MRKKISKRILSMFLAVLMLFCSGTQILASKTSEEFTERTIRDCMYLSDIPYIKEQSFASGNHTIHLDENESNDILTLKVEDTETSFIKGLCAWATSEIVYDLSEYQYDYFVSYLGVDISEQNDYFNTGVKFYIYTSNDAKNWEEKYQSNALYGWSDAEFAKVSIKGAKYLKLVADNNNDNWWAEWYDEAVYADARLITENYQEDNEDQAFIKTVAEYDAIIKNYADAGNYEITGEYEAVLLQREFVHLVGYDILQALAKYKPEYKETITWLMTDTETLRLYLTAGKPEGSYLNSIRVLTDLYSNHEADLENTAVTKYGTKFSDLYRTMILALSLTESGNVYLWIDGKCYSDALTRYQIYKDLHLHEGQTEELIENETFETLTVEEMRWVMNTVIDDEEIVWLNDYVRNEGEGKTSPYNYINYTFNYDYSLAKYYSQENYAAWDKKYHLSEYNITYESGKPKLWVVFEEGSVCGGLSKTGSCIWGAFKGLPNTCVSQPGHCAYIYYTMDENGNGIWNLGNDVSGWGESGKTEHLNVRPMNDWGAGSYTTGWNANYILLAQAAQNEYEKYETAEKILMLADIYKDDSEQLEKIYRKALAAEEINFDAWLGLVYLYEADETKTETDYYELAKEIVDALTYYPYPMNDLLNLIKPHFTSIEFETMFTLLQTRALTDAANATNQESIQPQAVKQVANQLLGNTDTSIASFAFDGADAGKIILSSRFDGTDVAWEYSLDNGKTWNLKEAHEWQLTEEELASVTAENDIKVHIVGVDYSPENIFTLDIQDSLGLPSKLYANDWENKLIGAVDTMEWKYKEADAWTSYAAEKPDLSGNTSVIVRAGATGLYLPEAKPTTYLFSKEDTPKTETYVSIEQLSIHSFSSQQAGSDDAVNAIDGNIHTIWHTAHNATDSQREIVLKLEEPIYLSAFQYVPRQSGTNGRAKNVELYLSMDGENWTKAASAANWENNADAKMLRLAESTKTQYVKFVTTENWGDGRPFASAAMLNLFEDVTKKAVPAVKVTYDITEKTTGNVTAKLLCPDGEITITNNNGSDTYVFTENGSFTFEFVDQYGNVGTAQAAVDWIVEEDGSEDVTEPDDSESTEDGSEDVTEPDLFIYKPDEFAERLEKADIVIKNEKVKITFKKGSKQNDTTGITVYDFTANVITNYEIAALSDTIGKDKFIAKVSYTYSGLLPAKATIEIFVGTEHAGKQVSYALLKADGTIDETEVQTVTVDKDGIIIVTQEHCSEYVITLLEDTSQLPNTDVQPPQTSGKEEIPKTGDSTSFVVWLAVISFGLMLIIFREMKRS